jgi:hypothetical protein
VHTDQPELTDYIWLNELASSAASPLLDAFRTLVRAEVVT